MLELIINGLLYGMWLGGLIAALTGREGSRMRATGWALALLGTAGLAATYFIERPAGLASQKQEAGIGR